MVISSFVTSIVADAAFDNGGVGRRRVFDDASLSLLLPVNRGCDDDDDDDDGRSNGIASLPSEEEDDDEDDPNADADDEMNGIDDDTGSLKVAVRESGLGGKNGRRNFVAVVACDDEDHEEEDNDTDVEEDKDADDGAK
jgi:hypothetical protein